MNKRRSSITGLSVMPGGVVAAGDVVLAIDGRTVQVQAPTAPGERVGFIAQIEELPLETMVPAAVPMPH